MKTMCPEKHSSEGPSDFWFLAPDFIAQRSYRKNVTFAPLAAGQGHRIVELLRR